VRAGRPDDHLSAVFLDRDGVINRKAPDGRYITAPAEFEFLPGAFAGLRLLAELAVPIVIATNQRGIALGRMSEDDLVEIHAQMLERVRHEGGRIDAIFHCPHDGGCACRKPLPGMLLDAGAALGFDPAASVLIGDSDSDMRAAAAVGGQRILIGKPEPGGIDVDAVADDLAAAARLIRSG
jgi:D-glycero-D-manno-heptose 1,7-bisphosphate phosphatase